MRYSEFQISELDGKKPFEDERDNWVISRNTLTRDTNAGAPFWSWHKMVGALEKLDPDKKDHQIHRFRHWAIGWFQIAIARPRTACAKRLGRRGR